MKEFEWALHKRIYKWPLGILKDTGHYLAVMVPP
jgi:hypothetical protein